MRPKLNAVAQVPGELDGHIASTGFALLRPDPLRIHPRYLFYSLTTDDFIDDIVAQTKGAGYPAVTDRIVAELPVDANGEFTCDWPESFFEERLKELF